MDDSSSRKRRTDLLDRAEAYVQKHPNDQWGMDMRPSMSDGKRDPEGDRRRSNRRAFRLTRDAKYWNGA